MNSGKSPAAPRHNLAERKIERFAAPVFDQAVEHVEISRIEDDARSVAISKAYKDLLANTPSS